jgi:DNA invertase Pin-like site-specific DNA recombinase
MGFLTLKCGHMQIGYARVSTLEQKVTPQIDQLKQAGCERIFRDKASGAKTERPGLQEALDFLREGDSLVVWRLDRLGRSLKHLLATVSELEERGVGFRSLQESIDTTTSGGRLIFHIFGALAEFERNLIRERTLAGLRAARARGRVGGRPRKLDAKKTELAYRLYDEKKYAVKEICQMLGVSKPTLYAYLARRKQAPQA